jgi:hypothetical protein
MLSAGRWWNNVAQRYKVAIGSHHDETDRRAENQMRAGAIPWREGYSRRNVPETRCSVWRK